MENQKIKLYGTSWCGSTRSAREYFEINNIEYEWIDIDQDKSAAEFVESICNGYRSVPTIVFPDGSNMIEPSLYELREKFKQISG